MVKIISVSGIDLYRVADLADKALAEGYLFVRRTIDEWDSGIQTFSGKGEGLWQVFLNDKLIGIGGVSRDPYINNDTTGRVRHVYILPEFRNKGYGKQLLRHIIVEARSHFEALTLFTENQVAASLYQHFDFRPATEHKVTHRLDLTKA